MLEKLLFTLFNLFVLVASSISPALHVGTPTPPSPPSGTLSLRTSDGIASATSPIGVLWVEVDGRIVSEDSFGVGRIELLRFKVSTRSSEGSGIVLGDRFFPLKPTDLVTIHSFQGTFKILGTDSPQTALLLNGTVEATLLSPSDSKPIRSERNSTSLREGPRTTLAYTVLGESRRVEAVVLEEGSSLRVRSEDVRASSVASIPASWVSLEGRLVSDVYASEGTVGQIEFQISPPGLPSGYRLLSDGVPLEVSPMDRVRIREFTGSLAVFPGKGGWRIKLDGVASSVEVLSPRTSPGLPWGTPGTMPPVSSFSWTPLTPTTSQEVQFLDYSYDPDGGAIVQWIWNFGDGTTSNLPCSVAGVSTTTCPKHRYLQPGTYTVTLEVRDETLMVGRSERNITVLNTPPVAEFTFTPTTGTDLTEIQFIDKSWDFEEGGRIVRWEWDFGDGTTADVPNPRHLFPDDGTYVVTLRVQDNGGDWSDPVRKAILLTNVPPTPSFVWTPGDPLSLEPVRFTDTSQDPDGSIVSRTWTINGVLVSTSPSFEYTFGRSGNSTVSLRVVDDDGDSAVLVRTIFIGNRPPVVSFSCTSGTITSATTIRCDDSSTDPDGRIVSRRWEFCDGFMAVGGPTETSVEHVVRRTGPCFVNLTVQDNFEATSKGIYTFSVENSPPIVQFDVTPSTTIPSFGFLTFTDRSFDPDEGDVITSRRWDFQDGTFSSLAVVRHSWSRPGTYNVTLTVFESDKGISASLTRPIVVTNLRPVILRTSVEPTNPEVGQPIHFNVSARDRDGTVARIVWEFDDGTNATGSNVTHSFSTSGIHTVTLSVVDDVGGTTSTVLRVLVAPPRPKVSFTWTPTLPVAGEGVTFEDRSIPSGSPLTSWSWNFGDGGVGRGSRVNHTFSSPGTYAVTLTVSDSSGRTNKTTLPVRVGAPPLASFFANRSTAPTFIPILFTPTAQDPDGRVVSYEWDFGDGNSTVRSNSTPVHHSYSVPGSYTIRLKVRDDDGLSSKIFSVGVRILNRPPTVPSFTASPTTILEGESVTFQVQALDLDGSIRSILYIFGDGTSQRTGPSTTHIYTTSGTYLARAVVTDNLGASTGSRSISITVLSNTSLTVQTRVLFPDGVGANLSFGFNVTARLGARPLPQGSSLLALSDGTVLVTLPVGSWMRGQILQITVRENSTGLLATGSTSPLPSGVSLVTLPPIVLPERLVFRLASILVPPSSENRLGGSDGVNLSGGPPQGASTFVDPTTPIRLRAVVEWQNGRPLSSGTLRVDWTYLGSRQFPLPSSLTHVTLEATISNSQVEITLPPLPLVVGNLLGGIYLPGWYSWSATALFTDPSLGSFFTLTSPSGLVYEDPGGATTLRPLTGLP